ncbi:SAM-dependent methyltransferase [Solicola sp. PLA-1-18]|uniref:SAM-dependent methyltransferase n=1 Tax=Solicola sp. PLA-1-18 TaxID=3380532 RepID=UPI003B7CD668
MSTRPLREAWHEASYGPAGFWTRESPQHHFRTSAHASDVLARAVLELVRRRGLREVVDLGAGGGELLAGLRALAEPGELDLVGVDLRGRPDGLPDAIGWSADLPVVCSGLLVAHEWLDDVPCDVVEVDDDGVVRDVVVGADGSFGLGEPVRSAWLERWWPVQAPGERAEVGSSRDDAWASAVERVAPGGVALAVDYGHLTGGRPPLGSLRAYRGGREVDVVLDGSCDVTAHVAVDSLADRVDGHLVRQRHALLDLGVTGSRPDRDLAHTDPVAYLTALSRAGDEAELLAPGGLGDFWWVLSER